MRYLRVKNFERFQHYKDRRPPWIKLYRDLWSDPEFFELCEADRYFLISFFVVASQNDNKIPENEKWLKREMATSRAIPVESLMLAGWLEEWKQDASTPLAGREQGADKALVLPREREETDTEIQEEKKPPNPLAGAFESRWARFPNRLGRKAAERHFNASVKTEVDLADLDRALDNYCQCLRFSPDRPPQNGSTWFNNWRDWIDFVPISSLANDPAEIERLRQQMFGKKPS